MKLTVMSKLVFSVSGMVALLAASGACTWWAIGKMKGDDDIATDKTAPKLVLFGTVNTATADMVSAQNAVVLYTMANFDGESVHGQSCGGQSQAQQNDRRNARD